MASRHRLPTPKAGSLIAAAAVALAAFFLQKYSPRAGYLLSLLTLVVIAVAASMGSIWPSRRRAETPVVFALFWGLIVGLVLPYVFVEWVL